MYGTVTKCWSCLLLCSISDLAFHFLLNLLWDKFHDNDLCCTETKPSSVGTLPLCKCKGRYVVIVFSFTDKKIAWCVILTLWWGRAFLILTISKVKHQSKVLDNTAILILPVLYLLVSWFTYCCFLLIWKRGEIWIVQQQKHLRNISLISLFLLGYTVTDVFSQIMMWNMQTNTKQYCTPYW